MVKAATCEGVERGYDWLVGQVHAVKVPLTATACEMVGGRVDERRPSKGGSFRLK
jgi:hypothetical protein